MLGNQSTHVSYKQLPNKGSVKDLGPWVLVRRDILFGVFSRHIYAISIEHTLRLILRIIDIEMLVGFHAWSAGDPQ